MWQTWFDMAFVMPMRIARIAGGGAIGEREAVRMVNEKIAANMELAIKMASGSLGADLASITKGGAHHYGRKVRANRKRLSSRSR